MADTDSEIAQVEIATFAVIVDAKDENAKRFYEREGFRAFPDQPMKLFLTMAEIEPLFA